jgi:hypothetical protein
VCNGGVMIVMISLLMLRPLHVNCMSCLTVEVKTDCAVQVVLYAVFKNEVKTNLKVFTNIYLMLYSRAGQHVALELLHLLHSINPSLGTNTTGCGTCQIVYKV